MKKMKKKISFFTKILLVVAMLFSNLSSLSVVFAYEETDDFTVSVTDEKIIISYLEEIEETDEVTATITENYTYLDDTSETTVEFSEDFLGSELTAEGGVEVTSQMLSNVLFDGLYELSVSLYNDTLDEPVGTVIYSFDKTFDVGFNIKLYDETDNELVLEDGAYKLDTDIVKFVATLNSGKLLPNEVYVFDEVEYTSAELLELKFDSTKDFNGHLYGEYAINLALEIPAADEEVESLVIDDTVNIMYKSYEENANELNSVFGDQYNFVSETKDGTVYVYPEVGTELTVSELVNNISLGLSPDVSAVFSNSQYDDILANYDSESGSIDEYLDSIKLDNSFVITLTCEDLTITYTALLIGDVNNDGVVDQLDLDTLVNQVVGVEEENLDNDFNQDEELNLIDVAVLKDAISNDSWEVETDSMEATLEGRLDVKSSDITSGDEFDIDYVLTLKEYELNGYEGIVNYDDSMLELVSVTNNTDYVGTNNEGHFVYVGDDTLAGIKNVSEENEVTYDEEEYVILTFKFRALSAGDSTVSIDNSKFALGTTELLVSDYEVNTTVSVNASNDNSLSSLNVSGQEITLEDGVLDYTIEVGSDVTNSEVMAEVLNVAASISSIVGPEELVEGENVFTITVVAENGDEKVYTVTVVRAPMPEEPAEQVNYVYGGYVETPTDNTENITIDDTPSTEEEVEPEKENSNLSRIIIVILILLVIAGLIYLIFKDEDDEETKKVNKQVNKLKNEDFPEMKEEKTTVKKSNNNNNKPNTNNKNNKNNKKKAPNKK